MVALIVEKALLLYERYGARLFVLDIMLPGKDGFYVLEKIRRSSNTPVLIVSAKTEKEDKLLSFSHDIKTPLSAIKLYSVALSKNLYPDAEKQHKTAENINEKADGIECYVSQIITASREDFFSLEVNMGKFLSFGTR